MQTYTIYKNGVRICQKALTLKECYDRTKKLKSGGRVKDLMEQGYSLVPFKPTIPVLPSLRNGGLNA